MFVCDYIYNDTCNSIDRGFAIFSKLCKIFKRKCQGSVVVVVVVLGFYVTPTAKVIRRRDLGLKSHP